MFPLQSAILLLCPTVFTMSSQLLAAADFLGILAFALAGILAAEGKKVDPVGVFVLAFTTAFGGGLIRDLIIDNRPFYWVSHEHYVWIVLVMALLAPRVIRRFHQFFPFSVFIWADAVGLGVFAVSGTALSYTAGLPMLPATMLGVCTGVFGGLIRDVFLNKVPMVLSDREPYASAAFLGSWVYLGLITLELPQTACIWIASILIIAIRMFCWYKQLLLISYKGQRDNDGTFHARK